MQPAHLTLTYRLCLILGTKKAVKLLRITAFTHNVFLKWVHKLTNLLMR